MEDIHRPHRKRDHCAIEYDCTIVGYDSVRLVAETHTE
jgi:hypothetical protein